MLTKKQIRKIVTAIGLSVERDEDWAQVALACIDQSMAELRLQRKIKGLLEGHLVDRHGEEMEDVLILEYWNDKPLGTE